MAPQEVREEPSAAPDDDVSRLHDLRFCALLGPAAWSTLPSSVRRRFSRRILPGVAVTYVGTIVESRRTLLGGLIAKACWLIGAPLPLDDDVGVPAVVTVTEDESRGGQFWTRMYGRTRGFPQVIHSSKRFAGPTGLEEYLGCGFGIALTVSSDAMALHFHSDHYFFRAGTVRLRIPHWLSPGELTISHVDRAGGWFAFILVLRHALFGELIHQTGVFRERSATQMEVVP